MTKTYSLPNLTQNSLKVLNERYLIKDENNKIIETPQDLFLRVARNIASADEFYGKTKENVNKTTDKFYEIMSELYFLPNTPTLMNAGNVLQQLSACFVLPVPDDTEGIFDAIKYTAIIHKSGGGTGFNFSCLRPNKDQVKSTTGVASGPISFMRIFNVATEIMKQGGRRRGANMGILYIHHPDIEEFIRCKYEPDETTKKILKDLKNFYPIFSYYSGLEKILVEKTQFNNFNISVAVTDEYMSAVKNNGDFSLINPRTKKEVKRISAKKLFEDIVSLAWENGEPGIIFIDTINKHNPTPHIGMIESTNPCGEQPLLPYESCNLGSINLSKFVKNKRIDYEKLKDVVETAVHFLDNVIDMNKYPLPEIEKITKANRKIGLGVMGFADMLIQMEIPYNSDAAIKTAEDVMSFIKETGRRASAKLAEERGVFPNFKGSIYDKDSKFFKGEDIKLRNATITTIAPTGSLSIIADCSSGIEPLIGISYKKNVLDNKSLEYDLNKYLESIIIERGFPKELLKHLAEKGNLKDTYLPEDIKNIFVSAHEIAPEWHVRMQAAFQKYTDNAVSKTINFPNSATKEDVMKAYMLAHELGCKGITIYRDKSRSEQVYYLKESEKASLDNGLDDFKRPTAMIGITVRKPFGLFDGEVAHLYVTGTYESNKSILPVIEYLIKNGKIRETFINSSKIEESTSGAIAAFAISTSRALRKVKEPSELLKKLAEDISDLPGGRPAYDPDENRLIKGIYHAISVAFKYLTASVDEKKEVATESIHEANEITLAPPQQTDVKGNQRYGLCPKCSRYSIIHQEGCDHCICADCGYSAKGCD